MRRFAGCLVLAVVACQGTDAAPAVTAVIGAAGGTVEGPFGAKVVIPPGALDKDTTIGIAESSDGAPPMPAGVTPFGPMFAFTPHGTTFAVPVTITVPFDPAQVPAGATPALYKTNAQGGWDVVPGATVNGGTMTGQVTGFSHGNVGITRLPDLTLKTWDLQEQSPGAYFSIDKGQQGPGVLDKLFTIGRQLTVDPTNPDPHQANEPAKVSVHVNGIGSTYWTFAQAPLADFSNPRLTTLSSELDLYVTFQKDVEDATLTLVITESRLETEDDGGLAYEDICTWVPRFSPLEVYAEKCWPEMLVARNEFLITVAREEADEGFFEMAGTAQLRGVGGHFVFQALPGEALNRLWTNLDFDVDLGLGGTTRHAVAKLKQPMRIEIPLDKVHKDTRFVVHSYLKSIATDRFQIFADQPQGDTYAGAFLRDPQEIHGVAFESTGLTVLPGKQFDVKDPSPVPCDSGIDPEAGTVQLAAPELREPELPDGARILVERSGGTKGEVAVRVETEDGTAVAGSDYQPVSTVVRFADGEDGTRTVTLPLVTDDVAEPDETVKLKLTPVRGCAALGERSSGILTIVDDDLSLPPTFTIGGVVTGLEGTGLTLRTDRFDQLQPAGNGPFAFVIHVADGTAYTVSVVTQPTNPLQFCTVTNGSGTVAGADVTNIAVDCATPSPDGRLDGSFGGGQGKIVDPLAVAQTIALQQDGKILALGGMSLSRYNADGSVDAAFGTGGRVAIVANGGPTDAMLGLALQPDGKIVVAGHTAFPMASSRDDMVILRYHADGSPDTDFGTAGRVVIDFDGMGDQASGVFVQTDGKIVAAGNAVVGTIFDADQDFAVVRVLPDGTPDPAFGSGGKATVNVAGRSDIATAAALAPDGRIVVVGRVYFDGVEDPNFGIARFLTDGTPDLGFGTEGTVRIDFSVGGVVPPSFMGGLADEPSDVAVQPDGKIVIVGRTRIDTIYRFGLARLTSDGRADVSFGTAGLTSSLPATLGDEARAIAFQPDGRIVVAGIATFGGPTDFAIARYTDKGTLDPSWGDGGLLTIDFLGDFDTAKDVLVQPDGKIVVSGSARLAGAALARVLP